MDQPTPPEVVAGSGRRFATFPVAVLAFIIDPSDRRFLMFSAPAKRRRFAWEPVSGTVETGETLAGAVERELREEAGPHIEVSWLGTIHAGNFRFDHRVPNMISVAFVAQFLGGKVVPSDDLAGCDVRWMAMDEIHETASLGELFPPEVWLFERAAQSFDAWGDRVDTSDESSPRPPPTSRWPAAATLRRADVGCVVAGTTASHCRSRAIANGHSERAGSEPRVWTC